MLRHALVITIVASTLTSATVMAQTPAQWREDFAQLRREAPARHVNLFHDMSRAQFDSALDYLDTHASTLRRHQIIVELEKLAALIGDGHTNVGPWRDSAIAFHALPIALYWFSDGLIIRATDSAHATLLGARVTAIGALPIDSVIARVRPLISRDNEMGIRAYTAFLLSMPEVLHAIGVGDSPDVAKFTVEKAGQSQQATLRATALYPMLTGDIDKSWLPRAGWVDARDRSPTPLWLSDQRNMYWFTYVSADQTLYCQINTIQQKAGDSLRTFMARAIATADSVGARRFVLDLRLNGGGDGSLNKQILLPLIKSRYDTPNKLFVITGRRTFSAAQMLVTELEKYSNATFVGEPTSSHGNQFGDSFRIVLANSHVMFRVSTLWHQYLDSRDKRVMIEPRISTPLSYADYARGDDPSLTATKRQ